MLARGARPIAERPKPVTPYAFLTMAANPRIILYKFRKKPTVVPPHRSRDEPHPLTHENY
jgi:hypothetical protein